MNRLTALCASMSLVLAALVPSHAQTADSAATPRFTVGGNGPILISAAESEDIAQVARVLGIALDEARARFGGQEQFASAIDELRRVTPESFAGAIWRGSAESKPIVWFVGRPNAEALAILARLPSVVLIDTTAVAAESLLVDAQIVAREAIAGMAGVVAAESTVVPGGGVVVGYRTRHEVAVGDALESAKAAIRAKLGERSANVRLEVREQDVPLPIATVIGGQNIPALGCTAAFTVTNGAAKGVLTAQHCANTSGISYDGVTLTYITQSANADGDIQWHAVGPNSITNTFRYTPGGGTRVVTSTSNPVSGSAICFWGFGSNSTNCGTVGSASYCDAAGYCHLFRASPSVGQPGDSGGPWYFGNVGKGVTRGYLTNGLGFRVDDLATQIGQLGTIGVSVKIAP